jgi:hypothetical protein
MSISIYIYKVNQKSAFNLKTLSYFDDITPAFWYYPTLFSKKLVFPCSEIISIQSNGFFEL